MRIYRYINKIAYLLILMVAIACSQDDFFTQQGDGEEVYVRFTPSLNDGIASRAFGDASGVTHLTAVAYYVIEGQVASTPALRKTFDLQDAIDNGFELRLMAEKSYKIIFWAQHESTPYTIGDNGVVTADYSDFTSEEIGIEDMEKLDAFYATKELSVNSQSYEDETPIQLTRPLGKLSIVDKTEPIEGTHTTVVTYNDVPKGFNALTASATTETIDLTVTFTEFTDETVTIDNTDHHYVATNYLFVPSDTKVNGTIKVIEGEVTNSDKEFDVVVTPNYQVVLRDKDGSIVESPDSGTVWDGVIPIEFPFSTLDAQNRYVIDEEGDIAWLSVASNAISLDDNSNFIVTTNLNMGNIALSSIQLPAGSTFDGGEFTIKGLNLQNGLFADNSTGVTIKNLTIDNSIVANNSGSQTHVGAIFNTLKSDNTIANVHVINTQVKTTNGAAGGIVGYVARSTENNRALTISVELDNCSVENTTISGSEAEGYFVGMLSGYDNNETLTFNENCISTENTLTRASLYTNNNRAAWLPDGTFNNFDQWLGSEKYYRGTVNYGTTRFVPKWDGTTIVEPLLANATYDNGTTAGTNRYVVYSPFDLAGVRKKTASPAAIYLRADIDMNGQGEDGKFNVPSNFTQSAYSSTDDKVFDPFNYVTTLDGQKDATTNFSIYNLSISQIEQERAAFVLYASGTTVHKNIDFRNCQTVAVHKPVTTDAKAYGAILVSNVDATYTMENVHAWDCKVFALQKVGTLGARISGTSTLKNNTVNNCYVENYECNISERFESGSKTMAGVTIKNVYADFYPYGEVGGMYGFIQGSSTLIDCKVNGTTIYAYGQDDKNATIQGQGLLGSLAAATLKGLGYYLVPGRHVSTLIGNIRATGTVTLTGCGVDSDTKCEKRHDKHNTTYNYIGQAYIVKFLDSEGSVTVDGTKLTLADCNKNTKR